MGRSKLTIENACRYTHFTWEQRLQLQYHYTGTGKYQKITSPTVLGKLFGKHEQTIRRELKRGMVEHQRTDLSTVIEYNAQYAHNNARSKDSAKGPPLKLGSDWPLVREIARLIKDEHYSPYAVIMHFHTHGWPSETRICEKTLYNYITAGDITGVKVQDLLYQGRRRKPKKEPRRHSRAANAAKCITFRPEKANERAEFGHWEIDTVVGGTGCSPACMLTLTERMTRIQISRKIPDRTARSVNSEIDKIERQVGTVRFRKLFKTLTGDNGNEFSDILGLEQSVLCLKARTQVFFAHPYSSFERGTNENHNGIIRRFIPKGSDLSSYTKRYIRETQDWMNNYPRKILGGRSPLQALISELGSALNIPKFLEVIR